MDEVARQREGVVVIRPGALGDTLLTLPALALLRRLSDPCRLTFVGRAEWLGLVRASGLADALASYDAPEWAALFGVAPARASGAALALRDAAVAVAWLRDEAGAVARALGTLGARRALVAPGQPAPGVARHMAAQLCDALRPLGVSPPEDRAALGALVPALRPGAAALREASGAWERLMRGWGERTGGEDAEDPRGRVVVLHPGSGGAAKRWPAERFGDLAARLAATGWLPLLLAGPADAAVVGMARAAAIAVGGAPPAVVDTLDAERLAALLARCRAVVANDAGPAHLAGLLGLPTLALFGPTDPLVWAPLGPRVRVLRAPDGRMAGLAVAAVWRALAALLGVG